MTDSKTSVTRLEVFLWAFGLFLVVLCHALNLLYKYTLVYDELLYLAMVIMITLLMTVKLYGDTKPPYLPEPDIELLCHDLDVWDVDLSKLPPMFTFKPIAKPTPVPVRRAASPTAAPNSPGYVYLMRIETGLYKIGLSRRPESRKDGISSGMPYDIELIHTIKCREMGKIEKYFLDKFAAKRVKGEWFALDPEDVEYFKVFTEA